MKKLGWILGMTLVVGGCIGLGEASADELFKVDFETPTGQDVDVKNYVSVSAEGDYKQTLHYTIHNNTNNTMEIEVMGLNAVTSPQGVIQYTSEEEENATILNDNYRMGQYVQAPDNVTLKGGETKQVDVQVEIPKQEGTVLGAIGFQTMIKGEEEKTEGVSFRLNSEMSRVIGLVVDFGGSVHENYEFGDVTVQNLPSYYVMRLPVSHLANKIASNTAIKYTLYGKDGEELYRTDKDVEVNFAPNTKTNLTLPWKVSEIKRGYAYKLVGELKTTDGEVYPFEKTFKYTGKNEDISLGQSDMPEVTEVGKFPWGWVVLGALLVGGILWIVLVKRKKRKKQKDN